MSWKKFGGTNQTEKLNNINVHSLVSDTFSLRQSYLGLLDISGFVNISEDLNLYGYANISKNVRINGNTTIFGNTDIYQNATIYGNIKVNTDVKIVGNLDVEQIKVNKIYLNDQTISGVLYLGTENMVAYLRGTPNGLGLNKLIPSSTLDIVGDRPESIKIYTTSATNTNILSQNVNRHGMIVSTTDNYTSLKIYNDSMMNDNYMVDALGNPTGGYDAQIQYASGGILKIDTRRDTRIMSHLSLYNNIVDASSYLYNVYGNGKNKTGNTITISTVDPSSMTFMNIGYPVNGAASLGGDVLVTGGSIGAGIFPGDATKKRSFLTLGLTDASGSYWPTQNIVSGKNSAKLRSVTGINTHLPLYDNYILDVNGPVRIANGEVSYVYSVPFQIVATSFSSDGSLFGVSIGNATAIANTSGIRHFILVTIDGGQTWSQIPIQDIGLQGTDVSFLNAYVYDSKNAIIVGERGFVFYTGNSGISWYKLLISNLNSSINSSAVYVANINSNLQRVFISYNDIVPGRTRPRVLYFNINIKSIFNQGGNQTISNPSTITVNTFNQINAMNGSNNTGTIYLAGDQGVCYINSIITTPTLISSQITNTLGISYKSIHAYSYGSLGNYNDYILAVGSGIITTITNNQSNQIDASNNNSTYSFQNVFINDKNNGIAIGKDTLNNPILYYTNNASQTWNIVSLSNINIINTSGNGSTLLEYELTSVSMSDRNSFVFTSWNSSISTAKVFYCYLPNLLNHTNNNVIDVCGNVAISGGMIIQDDVNINGSIYSSHLDMHPTDSSLNIGTSTISKTINIGNPYNVSVGSSPIKNIIQIGGDNDSVIIGGTSQNVNVTNLAIASNRITLNDISGTVISDIGRSSAGSGMVIIDKRPSFENGYFYLSNDYDGFLMKTTSAKSNILKIDVNHLKTQDTSIYNGLVVFRRATSYETDCSFVITSGTVIDISHIVVNSACVNQSLQKIGSPFEFYNTVAVYNKIDVSGITTFNDNTESIGLSSGALQVRYGGASIAKQLYVGGNTSLFYGNISIGKSATTTYGAPATTLGTGALSVTGGASVTGNVYIGGNIYGLNDAFFDNHIKIGGNARINGNLHVTMDASLNQNLYVGADASLNGKLYVGADASLNGKLYVGADASLNGNLYVGSDASLTGKLYVANDASLNGKLYVANDASLNGKLYVGSVTSLNGKLYIGSDASLNGNLYVNQSATFYKNISTSATANFYDTITSNSSSFVTTNTTGTATFSATSVIQCNGTANFVTTNTTGTATFNNTNTTGTATFNNTNTTGTATFVTTNTTGTATFNNTITNGTATFKNATFGNITATGTVTATTFNATSDYRIKDMVKSLSETFIVDTLRPVEYFNKLLNRRDVGLIAHELQDIYPFLVTGDKDGKEYQTINYTGLIGILIHEIQQLKKRVSILEGINNI